MAEPDHPEAVSVAEAAFMLGVSQATIRREIESGNLPTFRVRHLIRIPYSSIQKLTLVASEESTEC